MILKHILVTILLSIVVACNDSNSDESETTNQQDDLITLTKAEIENLQFADYLLSRESSSVANNWNGFNELDIITTAVTNADFSFFNSDKEIITALNKDLVDNIPETINSQSIIARIKVVETKMYKLQSAIKLNTTSKNELLMAVKEFLTATSNLKLQVNKHLERKSQEVYK